MSVMDYWTLLGICFVVGCFIAGLLIEHRAAKARRSWEKELREYEGEVFNKLMEERKKLK